MAQGGRSGGVESYNVPLHIVGRRRKAYIDASKAVAGNNIAGAGRRSADSVVAGVAADEDARGISERMTIAIHRGASGGVGADVVPLDHIAGLRRFLQCLRQHWSCRK